MPIDWQAIEDAGGFGKGRPAKLVKADRDKQRQSKDDKESDKVKDRSGGRCEVFTGLGRCRGRAVHVHHRLGGIGVRGRGESALAKNKLHVCQRCHSDIHGKVLVPDGNRFRRLK